MIQDASMNGVNLGGILGMAPSVVSGISGMIGDI